MTKPQANSKRPEKISAIREIDEFVKNSGYCFILNYGGLTVEQLSALRVELGKHESTLKVVKNTYLAKALEDKGWTQLETVLSGPTALVAGAGDPAEVAKAVVAFLKKNEQASVKGAQLEDQTLDAAQVKQLSELPGKDAMRAKLLGTLNAPATDMVRVLAASLKSVLYVLKAKAEKDGGAPAEA
ncbi:MAG: 50S ribosomal protein L10 [Kiritimatiellae bacterium]|nr:50S ribosomal protein L10 [Kiritimatiellia bacterium]